MELTEYHRELMENYKAFLNIRTEDLDREIEAQPQLCVDYSFIAAWFEKEMLKAEEAVSDTKAELYDEMRKNPARFDLRKNPTDKEIKSAISRHVRLKRSKQAHRKAILVSRYWDAIRDSFIWQRRPMIEAIVLREDTLYNMKPSVTKEEIRKRKLRGRGLRTLKH